MTATLYTVGHSTRSLDELMEMLEAVGAEVVVDVRRWPASRRNPQFSRLQLEAALEGHGMNYRWMGDALGGYRRFGTDVEDDGSAKCFRSRGFAAYAQYMLRDISAQAALLALEGIVAQRIVVILCAERLPWMCHRKLISDWILSRGHRVIHVLERGRVVEHQLTECAAVEGGALLYR